MNIKRIMKQVLKEEHEKGTYRDIFNAEVDEIIAHDMEKISKIALENLDIETYLAEYAEDCVRLHLIRKEHVMNG